MKRIHCFVVSAIVVLCALCGCEGNVADQSNDNVIVVEGADSVPSNPFISSVDIASEYYKEGKYDSSIIVVEPLLRGIDEDYYGSLSKEMQDAIMRAFQIRTSLWMKADSFDSLFTCNDRILRLVMLSEDWPEKVYQLYDKRIVFYRDFAMIDSAISYFTRFTAPTATDNDSITNLKTIRAFFAAEAYWLNSEFPAARRTYLRTIARRKALQKDDNEIILKCFSGIANSQLQSEDYGGLPEILGQLDSLLIEKRDTYWLAVNSNRYAVMYRGQGKFDSAEARFLEIASTVVGPSPHRISELQEKAYQNLGILYRKKGRYDESIAALDSAIARKKRFPNERPMDLGPLLELSGFSHYEKGNVILADSMFYLSAKIREKYFGRESVEYAQGLIMLGILNMESGEWEKSRIQLEHAIRNLKSKESVREDYLGVAYHDLGLLYSNREEFQNAAEAFSKSIEIQRRNKNSVDPDNAKTLSWYAFALLKNGEPDRALTIAREALALAQKYSSGSNLESSSLLAVGQCLVDLDRFREAEPYLRKSLAVERSIYPDLHPRLYNAYLGLSEFYLARKMLDSAMAYADRSGDCLKPYTVGLHKFEITGNRRSRLVEVLRTQKQICEAFMLAGNDSMRLDMKKLSLIDSIISVYDAMRVEDNGEWSRKLYMKKSAKYCRQGYQAAIELFRITREKNYLAKAFFFMEKSRSTLLNESIHGRAQKSIGNIPESLIKKEVNLRWQITANSEKITEIEKNESDELDSLLVISDSLIRVLDELVSDMCRGYPKYCEFRYDYEILSLDSVQVKLTTDELLLEYLVDEDSIFAIAISNDSILETSIARNEDFSNQLQSFFSLLATPSEVDETQSIYGKVGRSLYDQLVGEFETLFRGKNLLVIPDGPLIRVPFEALIHSDAGGGYMSFDYLVRDHNIRYGYSATSALQKYKDSLRESKGFLACAPTFLGAPGNGNTDKRGIISNADREAIMDSLPAIPGALAEVRYLNAEFGAEAMIGSQVTESGVKEVLADQSVVHFATHTVLDDSIPLQSALILGTGKDTLNDGWLTVEEIMHMDLDLDFACLSACQTGMGQPLAGEGPMSLSRAFSIAGCPSIIYSIWLLNDASSEKVVKEFYQGLDDGQSKDLALANAKRKYLEEASDNYFSQPYYWANLVLVGDPGPVVLQASSYRRWGIIFTGIIGLFILILILLRRRRKNDG